MLIVVQFSKFESKWVVADAALAARRRAVARAVARAAAAKGLAARGVVARAAASAAAGEAAAGNSCERAHALGTLHQPRRAAIRAHRAT